MRDDHAAAEPLFRKALELRIRRLGETHWEVAVSRLNLAASLKKLGRMQEAEREMLAAHEALKSSLGPTHPFTTRSAEHLVKLYDDWQKPQQAAPYRALIAATQATTTPAK
jgi:hypothetical protein